MLGTLLSQWYQVAGIVIAIPVVAVTVAYVHRSLSHMRTVHEAILGRPEGPANDAIPGIIQRFHDIEDHLNRQDARLSDIEGYLGEDRSIPFKPNGLRAHK